MTVKSTVHFAWTMNPRGHIEIVPASVQDLSSTLAGRKRHERPHYHHERRPGKVMSPRYMGAF